MRREELAKQPTPLFWASACEPSIFLLQTKALNLANNTKTIPTPIPWEFFILFYNPSLQWQPHRLWLICRPTHFDCWQLFVSLFHWHLFYMQVLYLWLHHIHVLPPDTEALCSASFHATGGFFFLLRVASCSETWKCVKHKTPAVNTYLPAVLKSSIYKTPGFK